MTRRIETNPLHGWDGITRPSPDPWPGLIDDIPAPDVTDEQRAKALACCRRLGGLDCADRIGLLDLLTEST